MNLFEVGKATSFDVKMNEAWLTGIQIFGVFPSASFNLNIFDKCINIWIHPLR